MKQYFHNKLNHFHEVLITVATIIFGLYSVVFTFISWNDLGCVEKSARVFALVFTIIVIFVITSFIVWFQNKNTVWRKGTGSFNIQYGDLMNIAFNTKNDEKK